MTYSIYWIVVVWCWELVIQSTY